MCPPPLATNDPVLEEQFDDRFLCHQFVLEIGLRLSAEKGDIKFSRWRARPHFIGLAAAGGRVSPFRCFRLRKRTDRCHWIRAPIQRRRAASQPPPAPLPCAE